MKKFRFSSIFLAVALIFSLALPTYAIEEMEVQAEHAVLIDATYGDILYDQSAKDKAYPASTTKIMTALLVLEAMDRGDLTADQLITCTADARSDVPSGSSTQNITVGESLSVTDLLYCLLLPSANEAANILAIAVGGDIPTFVEQMNSRAKALGCEGTQFVNAHGLHNDDHYTTAYDMALILQEAISHDLFLEITTAQLHTTAPTETKGEREFYNTNGLVSPWYYSGYTYSKSLAGKTGSTEEAGYCLAMAAQDKATEQVYISVILGAQNVTGSDGYTDRLYFTETARLLDWGFQSFKRTTIAAGDTPVAAMPVTLSQETDEVLLRPTGSIERTLPVDIDLDAIQKDITLFSDSVEAPVAEGDVLGSYTLTYEGEVYGVFDLIALTSVSRSELLDKEQKFSELLALRTALMEGSITLSPLMLIAIGVGMLALTVIISLLLARHHSRKSRRSGRRGSYSGRR